MWGTFLSEPLPIEGLVGRYPANFLMGRTAIHHRPKALLNHTCIQLRPSGINLAFASLSLCDGQVRYALLTRAPVDDKKQQAAFPFPLDLHVLSL